jgi:hypothetical protein
MGAKSKKVARADKTQVILLRQGIGKQDYQLPAGATLGDLLRAAQIDLENQEIFIDGKGVADAVVLHPGTIVSVGPRTRNGPTLGSWRAGLGMFQDDPTFAEMMEAVERSREAEKDRS